MKYDLEKVRQAFIEIYAIDVTEKKEKSTTTLTNFLVVYAYYSRKILINYMPLPLKTIGAFIGKDHATISFYLRRYDELITFDHAIKEIDQHIRDFLKVDEKTKPEPIEVEHAGYKVQIKVDEKKRFLGIISIKKILFTDERAC